LPRADSLAADIRNKLGFDVELIQSKGGIFDVQADGKLIFSKHEQGRFPEHTEVIDAINEIAVDR
jgi:selenoprotein W-related protein